MIRAITIQMIMELPEEEDRDLIIKIEIVVKKTKNESIIRSI